MDLKLYIHYANIQKYISQNSWAFDLWLFVKIFLLYLQYSVYHQINAEWFFLIPYNCLLT